MLLNNTRPYLSKGYIYFICLNATVGAIISGFVFVSYNACMYQVTFAVEVGDAPSKMFDALMSASIPFGGIFGALIGNKISMKYGRRIGMHLADLTVIIGSILSVIPQLHVMIAGRFICGIASGINYLIVPMYLREISPPEISGKTGSFYRLLYSFGILLTFLMSFGLESPPDGNDPWWRVIFLAPCIFAVVRSVNMKIFVQFEPARFHILKGDEDRAKKSLECLYHSEFVPRILESEKKVQKAFSFKEIFGSRYIKQSKTLLLLYFVMQFTGLNAITFYSTIIFVGGYLNDEPHVKKIQLLNASIGAIKMLSALIGGALADKIGRRYLLVYGDFFITICLFLAASTDYFSWNLGEEVFILIYVGLQGLSFSLILPTYVSELLPSYGVTILIIYDFICLMVVSFTFPLLPINVAFLIFAVVGAVGFIFIFSMVKETKGKTLNEIYKMFHAEKNSGLLDDDINDRSVSLISVY